MKRGDSLIIEMMNVTGSSFRLGTQDIIALADSCVSHSVIDAMVKSPDSRPAAHGFYCPNFWYPYDPFWGPWYYPFWDPWYHRSFSIRLGYTPAGGFLGHGSAGGHIHGGGRHH